MVIKQYSRRRSRLLRGLQRRARDRHRDRGRARPGSAAGLGDSDPWAGTPTRTAPETPAEKQEARGHRARARRVDHAEAREGARARRSITTSRASIRRTDDFRTFVHAEIAKELPHDKAADRAPRCSTRPVDEARQPRRGSRSRRSRRQAGAYYDPAQKKFFLVMVPDATSMLDTISAHELTHGLQDQHFDLAEVHAGDGTTSRSTTITQTARRFVVEGDATFTMFLYAIAQMSDGKRSRRDDEDAARQLDSFAEHVARGHDQAERRRASAPRWIPRSRSRSTRWTTFR